MKESDYHSTDGKCAYDASKIAFNLKKQPAAKYHVTPEWIEQQLIKGPVMVGIDESQKMF